MIVGYDYYSALLRLLLLMMMGLLLPASVSTPTIVTSCTMTPIIMQRVYRQSNDTSLGLGQTLQPQFRCLAQVMSGVWAGGAEQTFQSHVGCLAE